MAGRAMDEGAMSVVYRAALEDSAGVVVRPCAERCTPNVEEAGGEPL